jgi:Fe-S-cluster-containing hydrogenase component 2
LETCPSGAISKDNETGVVKIHQDLCVGCEKCRFVCPFGPETIKIENGVAVKCDLCGGKPACVDVCQPGALLYVTGTQAFLYKRRELVEKLTSSISKLRE